MENVKIGVIGGTGMQNMELFSVEEVKEVNTTFGKPSSSLTCGKLKGVNCVLLARHGIPHHIQPSDVNFRANMLALKEEGCTHIIATTACGSLKEEVKPGQIVIIDQFIDRTFKRKSTCYDGTGRGFNGICHIPMKYPFNNKLRAVLMDSCQTCDVPFHDGGTAITVEGPRFSTLAESNLYRSWGASIINMTTVPEVVIANELGLIYASLALVTDYDCWKAGECVDVEGVLKTMHQNKEMALKAIACAVDLISRQDWTDEISRTQKVASSAVM